MVNINNATSIISDAWSVAGKDVKRLNTVMNLCLAVLDGTPFHYRIAAAKRQIKLARAAFRLPIHPARSDSGHVHF